MPRSHTVNVGGDWADGFLVGRAAALSEWRMRKEIDDPEFKRLVDNLYQQKRYKNLDPETKARYAAYRKRWREENPERYAAAVNAAKQRGRKNGAAWYENEKRRKREKRAAAAEKRRRETIYTCIECGAQWQIGIGPLPRRAPKFCDLRCRSKHNHRKAKVAGKPWALRNKASARAGVCKCGKPTSRKGKMCLECHKKKHP